MSYITFVSSRPVSSPAIADSAERRMKGMSRFWRRSGMLRYLVSVSHRESSKPLSR